MAACPFVCMAACPFVYMTACPFVCMAACPFICIAACPFVCMAACPFVCMAACPFVCMAACPFVFVCTRTDDTANLNPSHVQRTICVLHLNNQSSIKVLSIPRSQVPSLCPYQGVKSQVFVHTKESSPKSLSIQIQSTSLVRAHFINVGVNAKATDQ